MELLDFDILGVANSEFGSNRKNRGNRFLTVIQYCLDMAQALSSMQQSVNENGTVIMIVGRESNVRKTAFYNGQIIIDICKASDMFSVEHTTERRFRNKFGTMIYEDILVLKPKKALSNTDEIARDVASSHLKSAIDRAPKESENDLDKAIASIQKVNPSPIYKYRSKE